MASCCEFYSYTAFPLQCDLSHTRLRSEKKGADDEFMRDRGVPLFCFLVLKFGAGPDVADEEGRARNSITGEYAIADRTKGGRKKDRDEFRASGGMVGDLS